MLNKEMSMTKGTIAELLGVSALDISRWGQFFADWLDVCPTRMDKVHDEFDIQIFTLINEKYSQIREHSFNQQIHDIERYLYLLPLAIEIREKRREEKERPEMKRWQVIDSRGICLEYDYSWLKPIQESVVNIVDFGCWATDGGTCSEPYALLWTLQAKKVVVVDKNLIYIQNARARLETDRKQHSYFKEYNVEFLEGDMTSQMADLQSDYFDLAYCKNVLYNMGDNNKALQSAISEMVRTIRSGGFIVAVEPKFRADFGKPEDMSIYFDNKGLVKVHLEDDPLCSYCYQKL